MPADPWPGEADVEPAKPCPEPLAQRCRCQVSTILLLQAAPGRACPPSSSPRDGWGYTGVCCRASIPRGEARSQPQAALRCSCRVLAEEQSPGSPGPFPAAPRACPCPSGCATQAAPGAQACASSFSLCQAGSLPSELQPSPPHRGIYRKAISVPKTAQPNPDAAALETTSLL